MPAVNSKLAQAHWFVLTLNQCKAPVVIDPADYQRFNALPKLWNTALGPDGFVDYAFWSLEVGQESGLVHIQGLLYCKKKITEGSLASKIHALAGAQWGQIAWPWVKPKIASEAQNEVYISKTVEQGHLLGPSTYGKKVGQGHRSDWEEMQHVASTTLDMKKCMETNYELFVRYGTGIQRGIDLLRPRRRWKTIGIALTGPTNLGKSTWYQHMFDEEKVHVWDYSAKDFANGYKDQSVVIIDEFADGYMGATQFKKLIDSGNYTMNVKQSFVPLAVKLVIVIGNEAPHTWFSKEHLQYPRTWDAIQRRFTGIYESREPDHIHGNWLVQSGPSVKDVISFDPSMHGTGCTDLPDYLSAAGRAYCGEGYVSELHYSDWFSPFSKPIPRPVVNPALSKSDDEIEELDTTVPIQYPSDDEIDEWSD